MGKTLHLFMLLALFFLAGGGISANAQTTVTFTAGTDKGTYDNAGKAGDKVTKDGITIETTSGNSAFAAAQYRFSKSSVTTFSSTVGNITKVVFTCTASGTSKYGPGCFSTPSAGSYSYSGTTGTWTGDAASFTLTASSNQVRATKIEVTYTPSSTGKTATTLAFADPDNKTFKLNATEGTEFTNAATLTPAVKGATITYSSDNENVAVVDENGGVLVTTDKEGKATITASYAGDDTYAPSSASYTITVQEDLHLTGAGTEADPYTVADALKILNKKKEAELGKSVYVKGTISRVVSTAPHKTYGSLNYDISDDGQDENFLYVYGGLKKDAAKFTSASEIAVGDIVLLKGDLQTYVKQNTNTPELNSNNTLEKFYERPETFDETSTESSVAAGHNVTATLKRTFNDNAWNTLVLPFDLTAEQIAAAFGADAKVAAYTGATAGADGTYTLNFKEATTITANTPVFIHSAQNNADGYTFTGVEVKDATPTQTADGFNFVGTYTATTVPVGNYFINSSNKFYKAGDDKTNIKGTRATFEPVGAATSAKGLGFNVTEDGTTTAINSITMQEELNANAPMYNLAGQQVTKAYKGVILQNGKKFINK